MKSIKELLPRSMMFLVIFTVLCGVIYTGIVTGISGILFPNQANGSIIEINGKKYGCEYLAQQYTDETYMWGRIMNLDVSTYKDEDGNQLLYAFASNLSPASEKFEALVAQRVEMIQSANPEMEEEPIPVDLVTCSGSGLDPHISLAAAQYQTKRIAKANDIKEEKVDDIIKQCTNEKFLGVFGEKTVNVLKVNLMLDGIL